MFPLLSDIGLSVLIALNKSHDVFFPGRLCFYFPAPDSMVVHAIGRILFFSITAISKSSASASSSTKQTNKKTKKPIPRGVLLVPYWEQTIIIVVESRSSCCSSC
jgi:hypothetical protein